MYSKKTDDNSFGQAILNSLEANICLLDEKGNIEFTNASWFDFAKENDAEIEKVSKGCNYLEVCDNAEGDDKEVAKQVAAGIRSVIAGEKDKFELEYPCRFQLQEELWFLTKVTPYCELKNTSRRKVVISHIDITKRKQAEKDLEEKNNKLNLELEKAKEVHKNILPTNIEAIDDNIYGAVHFYPAKHLGGDMYNIINNSDKTIFYLIDVTGHGLEAALISTFAKEAIESFVADNRTKQIVPKDIIKHLYKQFVSQGFPDDYFVSIFMGIIYKDKTKNKDGAGYKLRYTGAGFQEKVLLERGNEVKELLVEGPPISNMFTLKQIEQCTEQYISLKNINNYTVMVNSDGLTEQENSEGEVFREQLYDIILSNSDLPVDVMKSVINEEFRRFNDGSLQGADDITYLIIKKDEGDTDFEVVLNSRFEEIERLYSEIFNYFKNQSLDETYFQGLKELVINAMEHGNKFDENKKVYVSFKDLKDKLIVTVEDEGEGFDWRDFLDNKFLDLEGEEERGRGIAMTKVICDSLFYNEKGNKAFLILNKA